MSNYFALQRHIRGIRCFCSLGFFSCLVLSCLLIATILPIANISNNTEAIVGTPTSSTLTFASINSVASVHLYVDSTAGTFATSSDGSNINGNSSVDERAKFSVGTDNYTGYTLNIKSTDSSCVSADTCKLGNTFPSISSSATSVGFANNTWGYLPNYYNATGNSPAENTTTYYAAPTYNNAVTLRTTGTANAKDANTGELILDNYTIGLGIKADYTNPSGTYQNAEFILEYVANPVTYGITFNDDSGDTVNNMPTNIGGSTSSTTVAFPSNLTTPTRSGYVFKGWCLGATSDSGTVCTSGTMVAPGDTIGIDQVAGINVVDLYALWGLSVRVNFATNSGVASVTFEATGHDSATVSTSGGTAVLDSNTAYTMTMTLENNYVFKSWSLNNAGYGGISSTGTNPTTFTTKTSSGAIITATGVRLYTITYKANGGTGSDYTQQVRGDGDYLDGNNFANTNKYFKGWSTASGGDNTVEYRAGQKITLTNDITLYAVWGNSTGAGNSLYNIVASLNYNRTLDNTTSSTGNGYTGLNGDAGIKASSITKDNSGVFSYDASVFGASSDAANTSTIYLYRGILDNDLDGTTSTYGSNGNSANYPNYVKLGDTCWRIVRTTGDGGVKMIYNGLYSAGTTATSCANATTNAQTTKSPFNTNATTTIGGKAYTSLQYQNMHAAGYTYSDVAAGTTTNTALSTLLGSSGNDTTTNVNSSVIKQYIEDWYTANLDSYTSILQPSAGYCNDRTVYVYGGSYALVDKLQDDDEVVPYNNGMFRYVFGSFVRNQNSAQDPTLNCPRGVVDLYSTTTVSGGNGQLTKPVALLTADEASFAGSGSVIASLGSAANVNSFLVSGSACWLLSPSQSQVYGILLNSSQGMAVNAISNPSGVRPVISLAPGTTAASGSGTATDPWVVMAP